MKPVIPVFKVNYSIWDVLCAFFVHGDSYIEKLKKQICDYFDVEDVILTASGRGAIYHIVRSLPQSKVIIPAYTCEVVDEAIRLTGKEIVYAKVSKETLNISEYPKIDSDSIILATHQYGRPSEMCELAEKCKEVGAVLIEDCAGSLGSTIDGRKTGTFGDYAVFSFSASKTIQSPTKGGFIIARNAESLERLAKLIPTEPDGLKFKLKQLLKAFGFAAYKNSFFTGLMHKRVASSHEVHDIEDLKLDDNYTKSFYNWQACVVSKQFDKIDQIFEGRKRMVQYYDEYLNNPLLSKLSISQDAVNIRYAVYVEDRETFISKCASKGVQCGKGYLRFIAPESFRDEKWIIDHIMYLPCGCYTNKEMKKIVETLNSIK